MDTSARDGFGIRLGDRSIETLGGRAFALLDAFGEPRAAVVGHYRCGDAFEIG